MDDLQLREFIKKNSWDTRYHNSLKYMIHNCDDREVRNKLLTLVFIYNPYLAAQIYMTMCDDSVETIECIDSILGPVKEHAKKQLKKASLMMAYLELGRLEDFYSYYDKMHLHLEKKVYTYMVKRLSYEQLLYLADAVVSHKQTKYYSLCFNNIRFKYTPEYDQVLIQLIQKLFESNQYSICWKLVVGIGKDSSLRGLLGEELTEQYVRKLLDIGLHKAHTYGLYLILQYGYSFVFENCKEVIHNIIWDKTPIRDSWAVYFYIRFLNKHELDPLEQELIIKKIGFSKDILDLYRVNNPFQSVWNIKKMSARFLQKLKLDPILLEQHLVESLNTLQYPYSARETLPPLQDQSTEDRSGFYALFEKYMSKENLPKQIVFLFFNSLFRYLINLEYVVLYLKQRFPLSEAELKELFKDYILYGKVYKINANSVSIRCKNVLTTQTCCMYNRKCSLIRDGVTVLPQLGEHIYFKFDYIYEEIPKINVYLPSYILEEMYEDEKENKRT